MGKLFLALAMMVVAMLSILSMVPDYLLDKPADGFIWFSAFMAQVFLFCHGADKLIEWRSKRKRARHLSDLARMDAEYL